MKKKCLVFCTLFTISIGLTSCSKDEIINATDTNTVVASATITLINDLDFKTGIQATTENYMFKSVGTTKENTLSGSCATLTIDNATPINVYPKTIIVDFGNGCTVNNIIRKGKLKITLIGGPVQYSQSKMIIERENYYVNGFKIDGTIEYRNESTDPNILQWNRTITNGKIKTLLGDEYLFSGTHTIKQTEGVGTYSLLSDNTYELTQGTQTINKVGGPTLTLTITETLIKKFDCDFVSKGKVSIKGNLLNGTIDYGNGECDKSFKYIHENGLVFNLDI